VQQGQLLLRHAATAAHSPEQQQHAVTRGSF